METKQNHCAFGLEIFGLKEDKTDTEKISALEKHIALLDGLHNEATSSLERQISELKYPHLYGNKTENAC